MKVIIRYFIYIPIIGLVVACAGRDSAPVINRSYLKSKTYAEFQRQVGTEQEQKMLRQKNFVALLNEIPQCRNLPEKSLPLSFNEAAIRNLQKPTPHDCSFGYSFEQTKGTIKVFAHTVLGQLDIYWMVYDTKLLYTDLELLAGVFRNDKLLSFKTVGLYQKDLTRDVWSQISIQKTQNGMEITSETIRKIHYPFEQKNSVTRKFRIYRTGEFQQL